MKTPGRSYESGVSELLSQEREVRALAFLIWHMLRGGQPRIVHLASNGSPPPGSTISDEWVHLAKSSAVAILAGAAIGAVVIGGIAFANDANADDTAVVQSVVDGDTLDVVRDGETVRVRLLNVDTPETVDPGSPVECLGPEASAYLAGRLPEGTEVTLRYDEDREDRYGRVLAALYLGDELINAAIAHEGLGSAVTFEPNEEYFEEVEAAQRMAVVEGRGLHSADHACTLPGAVLAAEAPVADAAGLTTAAAVQEHIGLLDLTLADASSASALLDGYAERFPANTYSEAQREAFGKRIETARAQIAADRTNAGQRLAALATAELQQTEEREPVANASPAVPDDDSARPDSDRSANPEQPSELESPSQPEPDSQQPAPRNESDVDSSDPQEEPVNGNSNRAPCRAYAPGGQSFTYIDCVTKQPIG